MSPFARPSTWTYRENADERSESERIEEAVERHLANAGLRASLFTLPVPATPEWVEASRRAVAACDDSQAELFRLVEDMICVDPVRLGKALTA